MNFAVVIEPPALRGIDGADAFHVAIASLAGIDFVLTWNCKHLANVNKTRHLAVLNSRLGLGVPIITTPFSLTPETPDAA